MSNISTTGCTSSKRCTVLLKDDVYNRLRKMGRFGESFSDVISRLIDESGEADR
jgi:predicted CopG family antitoxin